MGRRVGRCPPPGTCGQWKGRKWSLSAPKTERSRRTLYLPQLAAEALKKHRTEQVAERLLMGPLWKETGLVFTSNVGTPLDGTNLTHAFQRILSACKCGHYEHAGATCSRCECQAYAPRLRRQRFHDLRHAAASLQLAAGAELREVMEMLGHSQISLTANLYTHQVPAMKQKAAARMDAALA